MTVINFLARFDFILTKVKELDVFSVFLPSNVTKNKNPFYPETGVICLKQDRYFLY